MRDGGGARVVGRIRAHVLHAEEITLVVGAIESEAKRREGEDEDGNEAEKELENAEKRKIQEKMEAKIERESRKIVTPGGTGLRAVVRRLLFPVVARGFERRPRNGPGRVGRRRDVSGCNALTHSYKYFRNCRKQYVVKKVLVGKVNNAEAKYYIYINLCGNAQPFQVFHEHLQTHVVGEDYIASTGVSVQRALRIIVADGFNLANKNLACDPF